MKKVLYEELLPEEFVQRMQEMPVAYLPLGTLEWHGPHMPLGADGIQSKELFVRVAEKVGGVVLPILFMGPDRVFHDHEKSFYGMDINTEGALHTYYVQQLKGSAYWLEKELFQDYLRSIFAQLSRAGVRIVVGHGHGPSTNAFQEMKEDEQQLLMGKYLMDLSDAELAQTLGCKASSIRMKLTRARRTFMKKLQDGGDDNA